MTKKSRAIIYLLSSGWSMTKEGEIYNSKGRKMTLRKDKNGYLRISVRYDGGTVDVAAHRFMAYIKYGNEIFKDGIEVRHLDGNSSNCTWDNIAIGTRSENNYDKPLETRLRVASMAGKKYDHQAILNRRKEGATIKQIMKEFNISSKGTVSFIINKSLAV